MKPDVGLDRVEIDVSPSLTRRFLGRLVIGASTALLAVSVGSAAWLGSREVWISPRLPSRTTPGLSVIPGGEDLEPAPPDATFLESVGRQRELTWFAKAAADPSIPVRVRAPPDTLEAYRQARGNLLYAMVLRDLQPPDPTMVDIADDTTFRDALDWAGAHTAFVSAEPLPARGDGARTRGLLEERDAWMSREPNRLVDAIHETVDAEVDRAASLGHQPTIDAQRLAEAWLQVRGWDWEPRRVDGDFPPLLPRSRASAGVTRSLEPDEIAQPQLVRRAWLEPATLLVGGGGGALGLLGLYAGLALLRKRRVRLSAFGLDLDGEHIPTEAIASVERNGPGVVVVLKGGRTLDLPHLGHVLATRVIEALATPESPVEAVAPPALQALRAEEGP